MKVNMDLVGQRLGTIGTFILTTEEKFGTMYITNVELDRGDRRSPIFKGELRKTQTNELVMSGLLKDILEKVYKNGWIVENLNKWKSALALGRYHV
jgi:hypothetical protein